MSSINRQAPRGSFVGPLILIALGIILLLDNLGLVRLDVWQLVLQLWPLLLIAIGLDILIGRRSLLGSVVVLVLVALMIAGGVWLVSSRVSFGGQALNSDSINQTLQGATAAQVEIDPSVATLRVGNTQTMNRGDLPADLLIIGSVLTGRDERVARDFQVTGNTARFVLKAEGVPFFPFVGSPADRAWDLNLAPTVPLELKVSQGVGDARIDLTGLNVTELDLSAGAGRMNVTLPAHGNFQARISGGVGDVVVGIPTTLSARVHISTGLGSTNISPVYGRQGDYYVSPGFDAASDRVEVNVSGGVGTFTVHQVTSQ